MGERMEAPVPSANGRRRDVDCVGVNAMPSLPDAGSERLQWEGHDQRDLRDRLVTELRATDGYKRGVAGLWEPWRRARANEEDFRLFASLRIHADDPGLGPTPALRSYVEAVDRFVAADLHLTDGGRAVP